VNSIIASVSLIAKKDTNIYSGACSTPGKNGCTTKLIGVIKSGQVIGIPQSYLRSDQSIDGKSYLMFYGSQTSVQTGQNPNASGAFFVPNESIDPATLKDQGVVTASEEIKKEQDEKLRADNPVLYYAKKIALPLGIGIGLIIIGKAAVSAYLSRPKKTD
jgi:hypothetical protein